jgi:antitoxin component YwqK of YwqJK toxin-antitoxin module
MKTPVQFVALMLLLLGCRSEDLDSNPQIDWSNLIDRGGVHHVRTTAEVFTGKVTGRVTGTMKDGKWDGLVRSFYSGTGALESETVFVVGRAEGLVQFWYENGQLKEEGNFADGAPSGKLSKWHENGELKVEATFVNGKLDGLAREWDETGQLREEVTFKDGKRHGLFRTWSADREVMEELCYQIDEEVDLSNCRES